MQPADVLTLCGTEPESIVDGPGFRFAVFAQGCPHRCPGCHNPQSHPFEGGYQVTVDELAEAIGANRHLAGVTLSGGEPFAQAAPMASLARRVHEMGKNVMTYTGYTYEQLLELDDPAVGQLLDATDILVDGPYLQQLRDLTLLFRGSGNQRLIDMDQTRRAGHVVLLELDYA